jgi:methyl-accepting chemotaxis protein
MPENNELLKVLKEGFDSLRAELGQTNTKLDQTNASLEQTNASLEQTNAKLEQTNAKLEQTNATVEQINTNLLNFRKEVTEKFDGLGSFLLSSERGYRALESRLFDLEQWRENMERRDDVS